MKKSAPRKLSALAASLAALLSAPLCHAQSFVNFTGAYSQNFDLALTNAATTAPPGFSSMYISGANSTYIASTPINAAGIAGALPGSQTLIPWNASQPVNKNETQLWNVGCWDNTNADRALGTDPTGNAANIIQLAVTNNTGGTLYGVTFSYSCKCLTNGSAGTEESELPGYCFFYSTTGTNTTANWTEVGYAGTVNDPGGVPAIHGLCLPNYTQGTTMTSGPVNITFTTPLANGGAVYFRWADDNNEASSPDQQLAIDDISIATYNPSGPVVNITSPTSGSTLAGPTISIQTSTSDLTGGSSVTNVSFYSGTTLLGNATSSPFNFTWSGVTGGSYSLTAIAKDNGGLMATSSVVSLTVTNPLVASFTGSYAENFDSDLSNSSTTLPAGFAAMELPGSHFTYTNAPGELLDSNAIATATTGSGASTLIVWNVGSPVTDAGSQLFNIGSWDSLNDRALGTDPTGTGGTVIQLALTNNTGGALNGVTFSYTEKCLTNGATSNGSFTDDGTERLELPGYEFFYSTTGGTVATNWSEVYPLCLTNWVQGTSSNSGPVNIVFATPLANGGVMYFRWADDNCVASSPDQMYAIDNVAITSYNPIGPVVNFTSPTNNENFTPGTTITLSAIATDYTTNITNVTFYADGSALPFTITASGSNYSTSIPGVYVGNPGVIPLGSYTLTVVAADAAGLSVTSPVVTVTVAYVPPTVSLTSPASGSSFAAPATIALSASAASADGTVTNVNYFQGSTLIGNATTSDRKSVV